MEKIITTGIGQFIDVTEKAKEIFNTGLFELHEITERGHLNKIKSREDLNNAFENGSTIGIKVVEENGLSEKINHLSLEINKTNREKGFWELYDNSISKEMRNAFISQALMLTVSELSEALEALRKGNLMTLSDYMNMDNSDISFKKKFEENVKDKFEDELADAIIRCLDIAGGLGIDIGWHIENKLLYNNTRGKMHGKLF